MAKTRNFYVCPECGEKVKAQGFLGHLRFKHDVSDPERLEDMKERAEYIQEEKEEEPEEPAREPEPREEAEPQVDEEDEETVLTAEEQMFREMQQVLKEELKALPKFKDKRTRDYILKRFGEDPNLSQNPQQLMYLIMRLTPQTPPESIQYLVYNVFNIKSKYNIGQLDAYRQIAMSQPPASQESFPSPPVSYQPFTPPPVPPPQSPWGMQQPGMQGQPPPSQDGGKSESEKKLEKQVEEQRKQMEEMRKHMQEKERKEEQKRREKEHKRELEQQRRENDRKFDELRKQHKEEMAELRKLLAEREKKEENEELKSMVSHLSQRQDKQDERMKDSTRSIERMFEKHLYEEKLNEEKKEKEEMLKEIKKTREDDEGEISRLLNTMSKADKLAKTMGYRKEGKSELQEVVDTTLDRAEKIAGAGEPPTPRKKR